MDKNKILGNIFLGLLLICCTVLITYTITEKFVSTEAFERGVRSSEFQCVLDRDEVAEAGGRVLVLYPINDTHYNPSVIIVNTYNSTNE